MITGENEKIQTLADFHLKAKLVTLGLQLTNVFYDISIVYHYGRDTERGSRHLILSPLIVKLAVFYMHIPTCRVKNTK